MKIDNHPAIATPQPGVALPPSWAIANVHTGEHLPLNYTILAQLASLSVEDFQDAQKRRHIIYSAALEDVDEWCRE